MHTVGSSDSCGTTTTLGNGRNLEGMVSPLFFTRPSELGNEGRPTDVRGFAGLTSFGIRHPPLQTLSPEFPSDGPPRRRRETDRPSPQRVGWGIGRSCDHRWVHNKSSLIRGSSICSSAAATAALLLQRQLI